MKNKILEIMKFVLNCEVNENSEKGEIEEWDSLNHVRLMLELKDSFKIDIPVEMIDKLTSFFEIHKFIMSGRN